MKLSLLFFIIVVVSSCNSKYKIHQQYLSDSYEKSIDSAVFVPYRQGDKWFYVDRRTKGPYAGHAKAFENEYDAAYPFNPWFLAKIKNNGKWFFIDTVGNKIIDTDLKNKLTWDFSEEIISYPNSEGKWGSVNINGDTIVPFKYKRIGHFKNEKALLQFEDNSLGIIDNRGVVLVDPGTYSYLEYPISEDDSSIRVYGVLEAKEVKYGFLNRNLKKITPPLYEKGLKFVNDIGVVKMNGKYGYVNFHGELVIPCIYEKAKPFYDKYAIVSDGSKYGIISKKGDTIGAFRFDYLSNSGFNENIMPAKANGYWGIINIQGKTVVDFQFEDSDILNYKYGLIAMKKNGKWGMIDSLGNVIINFEYDVEADKTPYCFTPNRIIIISKENKKGIINRKNEKITGIKYDIIEGIEYDYLHYYGLLRVVIHGKGLLEKSKEGYIDIWGKEYFED